tara:strand:+ start:136 stop:1212 length:1077 start_codon:yes stop_codon:yes gene_type:complete
MVLFYNQADQDIYNKGIKFLPQEKYRMGPYTPIIDQESKKIETSFGIPAASNFNNSGGNNFSVYNADPNTITNKNPNQYALQDARYDNELSYVGSPITGYTTDTEAIKNMENYPEYYGLDAAARKDKEPTKFQELISRGIDFIPGIGAVKKGAEFLSNIVGPYMPINRRAIMENQAGIDGVMINDIGQIVVGQGMNYNTPEGIMAGYNYNQMTDKTFTDRQKDIGETLQEKYGLTKEQVDGLISGELTEEDFTGSQYNLKGTKKQTNLITNLINIEIARKNFKEADDITGKIVDIKKDTKSGGSGGGGDGTYGLGSDGQKSYDSGQGFGINATTGGPVSNKTGRGRTDYKHGGLASIL